VPLVLAVAAAESKARPESFDLPEPHERLQAGRLVGADDCIAAEIFDDSADLDFGVRSILFVRELARLSAPLRVGDKVLVRFYLEPGAGGRTTHEILNGILDQNIVGDLVLVTRTRNRLIPRHAMIQSAAPAQSGFAERALHLLARDGSIVYEPHPDAPAEILGVVVYAMGPL